MTSRASASAAMALDDLRQLFEGAKRSVFRLETLPVYEVGEDIERQRGFAAEGRLPPPSPDRVAFIRRMQERTRRVAWSRVHVVDQPLTPYLRYELAAYAENEQGGEQVWIADRATHPSLADLTEDFVLVDDEAGVWFRYDERGRLVGYERVAPEDLDRCREQRDLALAHAVRLRDYQPPPPRS
jgi:Family of unknown function (DUF6879)